jgi:hypothetical protein
VSDQPRLRAALGERHLQRICDELGAHVIGHAPADDPAAEEVLDGDRVQPPLSGAQVGDVGDPDPVGRHGGERAIDEVNRTPARRALGSSCGLGDA